MSTQESEETTARWLEDFAQSAEYTALDANARIALGGVVRLVARFFTRRWSDARETSRAITEMTAEDVVDILTKQFPYRVCTNDDGAVLDGASAFLVWAAKHGRIRDRRVEYASRTARRDAAVAMKNERVWSAGKAILMAAVRDGVDAQDAGAVREHALARGMRPDYVDEFLPAGPTFFAGAWRD